jgi:hypothetical protein
MRLHVPVILTDGGPWAEHDHACSVCAINSSVLNLNTGIFEPCWLCQGSGWRTTQLSRFALWRRRRKGQRWS